MTRKRWLQLCVGGTVVLAAIAGVWFSMDRTAFSRFKCAIDIHVVRSSLALKEATDAIESKDYSRAIKRLDEGLSQLGDYQNGYSWNDDSGMHLIDANVSQRQGDIERSATSKRSILAGRIEMYRLNHHCFHPDPLAHIEATH